MFSVAVNPLMFIMPGCMSRTASERTLFLCVVWLSA